MLSEECERVRFTMLHRCNVPENEERVVAVGNRCSTTPHGGNTVAIPLGGNGHVTPSRPTHGLGIDLLIYLRSFSPT